MMEARRQSLPAVEKRAANHELVSAHRTEAEALRYVEEQQIRVATALDRGAQQREFHRFLERDREADFAVYFFQAEQVTVAAVELREIDGRMPSASERAKLERQLSADLVDGGQDWLDFLSEV